MNIFYALKLYISPTVEKILQDFTQKSQQQIKYELIFPTPWEKKNQDGMKSGVATSQDQSQKYSED